MEAGRKGFGKMVNGTYIIDACAMIAYLNNETGSHVVNKVLQEVIEGVCVGIMHKINLLGVYYDHIRNPNAPKKDLYKIIESLPINLIDDLSKPLFDKIIQLKSSFRISLADSFVLATAMIKDATVITSDHREMDIIEKSGLVKFLWIR